jgi:ADP-L-glycero-D-manno-heptose 6-epimerase
VYVRDLARLNLFFAQVGPFAPTNVERAKVYQTVVNAGSGCSRSFNEVASILIQVHGDAKIEYVPMPRDLDSRYQHFTEADLGSLRETGCNLEFTQIEKGIPETFETEPLGR